MTLLPVVRPWDLLPPVYRDRVDRANYEVALREAAKACLEHDGEERFVCTDTAWLVDAVAAAAGIDPDDDEDAWEIVCDHVLALGSRLN